jgi:hypothetical protein
MGNDDAGFSQEDGFTFLTAAKGKRKRITAALNGSDRLPGKGRALRSFGVVNT